MVGGDLGEDRKWRERERRFLVVWLRGENGVDFGGA